MVYAIFFGFTYQSVTERSSKLDEYVNQETSAAKMVMRMALATPDTVIPERVKLEIAKHCREAMLSILDDLFGDPNRPHEDLLPGMQAILPMLHDVQEELSKAGLSKEVVQLAVHNIKQIHETVVSTGPIVDRRHKWRGKTLACLSGRFCRFLVAVLSLESCWLMPRRSG